jgi:hypothetical protein
MLNAVIQKWPEPVGLRGNVAFGSTEFKLSERTACELLDVD